MESKLQSRHDLYIENSKGELFRKNVGGVSVVYLCMSSVYALYFYQVLRNYLERYQSYTADTISILKIRRNRS